MVLCSCTIDYRSRHFCTTCPVTVPVGSLVEFWKDEKWNMGKIAQNPQTKQLSIIDVVSNKTMVDKIEQIKARVRSYQLSIKILVQRK